MFKILVFQLCITVMDIYKEFKLMIKIECNKVRSPFYDEFKVKTLS